jgi:hypothetical protein
MKNKIDLKTERMSGYGSFLVDGYEVNYLFGLNDLCEKYVKDDFLVLELGSNDGRSTSLFSFFAKKVISVDMNKTESMKELLKENDKINFNHMTFSDFLKKDGDTQYDLVYIDGGHDFNSVDIDIELFKGKVKKNGYIGGHDYYNYNGYGVIEAVNKHFSDKEILVFSDSSWLVKL